MTNYKNILYQKQRNGVLITLNRPNALNAMNEELMNELDQALAEAETDPEIRAVVITGTDGAFSVVLTHWSTDPGTSGASSTGVANGLGVIAVRPTMVSSATWRGIHPSSLRIRSADA